MLRSLKYFSDSHKTNLYDSETGKTLPVLSVYDAHELCGRPTVVYFTKDARGPIVIIVQGGSSIHYHVDSAMFEEDGDRLSRLFNMNGPDFVKIVRSMHNVK